MPLRALGEPIYGDRAQEGAILAVVAKCMQSPRIQDYDECLRYDLHGTPAFDLNLRLAER